jgi:general secretion pathway protein J
MTSPPRTSVAGFTLIEALVATVLMGLVLASLATITARWLPNWNRGFVRVQRNESLEFGLERIVDDLASAEFIPPNARDPHPLFDGTPTAVVFVRSAIAPNDHRGLDIIRIAEMIDARGSALIRSRRPFAPTSPQATFEERPFTDPVALIRLPYRVSFSYAGRDRVWKETWHDAAQLPSAVRISVRDAATQRLLPVSTAVALHVDAPAQCAKSSGSDCSAASGAGPSDTNNSDTDSGANAHGNARER